jgi:hypothetical protein
MNYVRLTAITYLYRLAQPSELLIFTIRNSQKRGDEFISSFFIVIYLISKHGI